MNNPKVSIYKVDDWQALYIDGELIYENHKISPEEVLQKLGITYKVKFVDTFDVDEHEFPKKEFDLINQFFR